MKDDFAHTCEDPADYAEFLEERLDEIEKVVCHLLIAKKSGQLCDEYFDQIEEWLGNDWWVSDFLTKAEQRIAFGAEEWDRIESERIG